MTPNLYQIALADSAVVGLLSIGGDLQFYRDEAPQGIRVPYVRWFVVFGEGINKLDSPPDMDASRVQFDVFAADPDAADAIYVALRNCLEEGMHGHIVGYGTERDPETRNFRVMFEMSFKTDR